MENRKTYQFSAYGTDNEITLWNFDESLKKDLFLKIHTYECNLSYYQPNSYVSKINLEAGKNWVKVDEDTIHLITQAKKYYQLFQVFNILLKPVQEIYMNHSKPPNSYQIWKLRKNTRLKDIELSNSSVKLSKADMKLDLGGIAKGYIIDKIKEYLQASKLKQGILNFGGDVIVWSEKATNFNIGIRDPFQKDEVLLSICLSNKSISTSGVYERFNKMKPLHHHVIDPRNLRPSKSNLVSVSVVTQTAMESDVLATVFLILGMEASVESIHKYNLNCEVIFITKEKKIFCTKGMFDQIEPIHSKTVIYIVD